MDSIGIVFPGQGSQYAGMGRELYEGFHAAREVFDQAGARMVLKPPISVPGHRSLLDEAAQELREYPDDVAIHGCGIPIIPNFDPEAAHSEGTTKELLARQLNAPARWQKTVARVSRRGYGRIVGIGPQKTLLGLIRRIDRDTKP